ncbi:hypothetical protein [Paenibacillus glucanolyticus]
MPTPTPITITTTTISAQRNFFRLRYEGAAIPNGFNSFRLVRHQ